ncbi:MAG: M60 family metallopeptidase [Pseudoflavonifractor sp.]|nr:M60 family metallopeptidase [Alloprevotella sp.]MCM1117573.1 M60 family metallopeptidase [Pseudoflavonifractor sp.]
MKQHLLGRISLTALFALLAICGLRAADIADGKVYQIVNDRYKLAMSINGPKGNISCSSLDAKNLDQLWEVKSMGANKWALQNLTTGTWLKSSGATSSPWKLADEAGDDLTIFEFAEVTGTGTMTIRPSSQSSWGMAFAHCDAGKTVVCWDASASTSQWVFTEATITDEDKANAANRLASMNAHIANAEQYQAALSNIFADKACTTLKGTPSDADLAALPDVLKAMVKKVQSGDWSETNYNDSSIKWDSQHAKKFRVQSYEVYSRGAEICGLTGIQAYTNMNNPTGIMANSYDCLFIMVDQAPKDGSTLYYGNAPGRGMYNDWKTDTELHEGLNVVPVWGDHSMGYIYYTADTYSDGKRQHKLAEFPDIKIHIEGGLVNSFYNSIGDALYTPDKREDFNYYRDRAQHWMYDIMGRHMILHFFFDRTETDEGNGNYCDGVKQLLGPDSKLNIETAIHQWDELGITEKLVMGLMSDDDIDRANADAANGRGNWYDHLAGDDIAPSDLWEYFNNRHMGITMQGGLYMNATSWRTAYNGNTMSSILDLFNGGSIWGPAHEFGHCNQGPMKIAGTTEISNNHFSNVAVYTHVDRTIRANMIKDQVDVFNKGLTFLENGIWGTTRMYFQLWYYYHALGKNKKFYPRLYELLRKNPLQKSYYLNPRYDALHFVKMCCVAAQEDLTDYFEAWGMFVPLENYHIGDYSNFMVTLTQEDIDAVKKEIKAYGFKPNRSLLFIDERVGSKKDSWADYMAKEDAGDLGSIESFRANTQVTKPYTYLLNGTNVKMSGGEGGVGFMIYSDDNKLLGFSNSYEFPVSTACAQALLNGTARVVAMSADNKETKAESTFASLTAADQAAMLQDMIDKSAFYVENVDSTATKIGRFKVNYVARLNELREQAIDVIAKADANKYSDAYTSLANEYFDLTQNDLVNIPFIPGGTYHLTLRGLDSDYSKALSVSRNNVRAVAIDMKDTKQHWVFEPAGGNKYYIKNVSTGNYIQIPQKNEALVTAANKPEALTLDFVDDLKNAFINVNGCAINFKTGNQVIGWDASAHLNSQWLLTKVSTAPLQEAIVRLEENIATGQQLLAKAGTVDGEPRQITFDPQVSDDVFFSNAKCKSTQHGDQFTSFIVVNDTTSSTFFHSDYSGSNSDDGLDHYIGINLGENEDGTPVTVTNFHIGYTTRGNGNVCAPSEITIQGSLDGEKWTDLLKVKDGLPSGNDKTYITEEIRAKEPVRYVRMMVHKTHVGQQAGGHQYFIVSEFRIYSAFFSGTPSSAYPAVTEDLLHETFQALKDAQKTREEAIAASRYKAEKVDAANHDLYVVIEKLAAAMGVTLGVDGVIADDTLLPPSIKGIYDLQGRRLRQATAPGIYIIDGRKTIVR